jgi:O-antigen/teichoic acid export membrane protein
LAFLYFSIFRLVGSVTLNLIFLFILGLGYLSILVTPLILGPLLLIGLLWFCGRDLGRFQSPAPALLKDVMRYSVPLGIGGIGLLIIHYGDRYFLSRYSNLNEIGIYSLAYKIGMLLAYLSLPILMFWRSQVHVIMKSNDDTSDRAFVSMFTFVAILYAVAWYSLSVLSGPIIRLAAGPQFQRAAVYVPWIAFAYLLRALTAQIESAVLVGSKTIWIMFTNWLSSILCLAVYWYAIPRYGVWGAIGATTLGFGTMLVSTMIVSRRVRPRAFETRKILSVYMALALLMVIWVLIPTPNSLSQTMSAIFFVAAAPFVLLSLPALSAERKYFSGLLRSVLTPKVNLSQ